MKTLVIAEPGCTAEGKLDTMCRLIEAAAAAGSDVWKAQWTSNPDRMCERRRAPEYRRFYEWLAFPVGWHADLKAYCEKLGLQYACSVYLPEDCFIVAPFVEFIKVSSFEAGDRVLLGAALLTKRPVYVSTGMMSAHSSRDLSCDLRNEESTNAVLRCVSAYPSPLAQMHLRAMRPGGLVKVGLSDHSREIDMGAMAVAAGARIVEAHHRLDDCDPENPDFTVAFSPTEFQDYVALIRRAETIMGERDAGIQPCEQPMLRYRVTA